MRFFHDENNICLEFSTFISCSLNTLHFKLSSSSSVLDYNLEVLVVVDTVLLNFIGEFVIYICKLLLP